MVPATLRSLPRADLDHTFQIVGDAWRSLQDRRLFITGGTGFVGKWLLETLLDANQKLGLRCEITVLSRNPAAFAGEAPHLAGAENLKLLKGDVCSFVFPEEPVDIVIHAATDVVAPQGPLAVFDACVGGTRRVLDFALAARASRFLLVSSGAVYGRQPADMSRVAECYTGAPDVMSPNSAYGEGKRASEWLTAVYGSECAMAVNIARCYAFVGPYLALDKHFAIGNFIRDAMAGAPIAINGDGSPLRTYLHAADMAAWLWTVLLKGQPGQTYNVGGAEIVSIRELAGRVVDVLCSPSEIIVSRQSQPGVAPERYVPDISKAASLLGLKVEIPLDDAISRTAAYINAAYHVT